MLSPATVDRYLRRLGVDRPGPPTVDALRALHRAHVTRVPYENLEIQLGRTTTLDPQESAERIIAGRGGYCFHLNGALAALLEALGYEVTHHFGGVHTPFDAAPPGANGNHMALTVRCEGELWYLDPGLGGVLYDALPLRAGRYHQDPFRYVLAASEVTPGGWRLQNDGRGSFLGMDFSLEPAAWQDFIPHHQRLSTSPESPFVQAACALRRHADGYHALRGLVLTHEDPGGKQQRELTSADEWFGTLAEVFGLDLPDVGPAERAALWDRVQAVHRQWLAAQAEQEARDAEQEAARA
ncbi:arylamine N-acetyltransferase family protein [Kitasatospora camelliae]|uniref:Arylamine N-acetyltransferase n=1 Tax=Kitasatospora camelliae TaxID=3156397 RepID=A0AAU8K3B3_9ACTN